MLRIVMLLLIIESAVAADPDPALRPDSLIFSHVYPLGMAAAEAQPLYLTRRGEYYAEIILERAEGSERPLAVDVDVTLDISLRDRRLFERALETTLGRARPAATLFWLSSDREVPIKTPLTMNVMVAASGDAQPSGERVRIQIRRKINPGLPYLR